jgi:hypothetical protein
MWKGRNKNVESRAKDRVKAGGKIGNWENHRKSVNTSKRLRKGKKRVRVSAKDWLKRKL